LHEIGAHLVEAPEILVDHRLQPSRELLSSAALFHPLPEVAMVVVLANVVDHRPILGREGLLANDLDWFSFVLGAGTGDSIAT
jgi:hypothetical protein